LTKGFTQKGGNSPGKIREFRERYFGVQLGGTSGGYGDTIKWGQSVRKIMRGLPKNKGENFPQI